MTQPWLTSTGVDPSDPVTLPVPRSLCLGHRLMIVSARASQPSREMSGGTGKVSYSHLQELVVSRQKGLARRISTGWTPQSCT